MKLLAPVLIAVAAVGGSALAASPPITVVDVWSRPADGTGVVYATIRNRARTADALVGATSSVARTVEVHETMSMPARSNMSGGMMMQHRSSIPVSAAGSLRLKPGGYHIMLIGLRHPLRAGERVPVTLRFRNAGAVEVVSHVENRAF